MPPAPATLLVTLVVDGVGQATVALPEPALRLRLAFACYLRLPVSYVTLASSRDTAGLPTPSASPSGTPGADPYQSPSQSPSLPPASAGLTYYDDLSPANAVRGSCPSPTDAGAGGGGFGLDVEGAGWAPLARRVLQQAGGSSNATTSSTGRACEVTLAISVPAPTIAPTVLATVTPDSDGQLVPTLLPTMAPVRNPAAAQRQMLAAMQVALINGAGRGGVLTVVSGGGGADPTAPNGTTPAATPSASPSAQPGLARALAATGFADAAAYADSGAPGGSVGMVLDIPRLVNVIPSPSSTGSPRPTPSSSGTPLLGLAPSPAASNGGGGAVALSGGAIAGIAIGGLVGAALLAAGLNAFVFSSRKAVGAGGAKRGSSFGWGFKGSKSSGSGGASSVVQRNPFTSRPTAGPGEGYEDEGEGEDSEAPRDGLMSNPLQRQMAAQQLEQESERGRASAQDPRPSPGSRSGGGRVPPLRGMAGASAPSGSMYGESVYPYSSGSTSRSEGDAAGMEAGGQRSSRGSHGSIATPRAGGGSPRRIGSRTSPAAAAAGGGGTVLASPEAAQAALHAVLSSRSSRNGGGGAGASGSLSARSLTGTVTPGRMVSLRALLSQGVTPSVAAAAFAPANAGAGTSGPAGGAHAIPVRAIDIYSGISSSSASESLASPGARPAAGGDSRASPSAGIARGSTRRLADPVSSPRAQLARTPPLAFLGGSLSPSSPEMAYLNSARWGGSQFEGSGGAALPGSAPQSGRTPPLAFLASPREPQQSQGFATSNGLPVHVLAQSAPFVRQLSWAGGNTGSTRGLPGYATHAPAAAHVPTPLSPRARPAASSVGSEPPRLRGLIAAQAHTAAEAEAAASAAVQAAERERDLLTSLVVAAGSGAPGNASAASAVADSSSGGNGARVFGGGDDSGDSDVEVFPPQAPAALAGAVLQRHRSSLRMGSRAQAPASRASASVAVLSPSKSVRFGGLSGAVRSHGAEAHRDSGSTHNSNNHDRDHRRFGDGDDDDYDDEGEGGGSEEVEGYSPDFVRPVHTLGAPARGPQPLAEHHRELIRPGDGHGTARSGYAFTQSPTQRQ